MDDDHQDRRSSPRAPVDLDVEYRKLNAFFQDYTRNISKGGTFIRTGKPLEVGTEFNFKLTIPELPEPLSIRGRVQWVVSQENAGVDPSRADPGMGIQFIYGSDDERQRIESIVERLMKKHLGEIAFAKLMKRD